MTDKELPNEAGPQGEPPDPGKPRPAPPSEILSPSLAKALQSAGVDPKNPDITKTVEIISLNMMTAIGSLPLPPPAVLSEYNEVFPGLADQIVKWTEEQRHHRMKLEIQVTTGAEQRMNRGQLIAAGVALIGLSLAALVGIVGNPWAAAVIAVVSIGGPTAAVYLARGNLVPAPRRSSEADRKS
jgi:uncharacterized membrane protein